MGSYVSLEVNNGIGTLTMNRIEAKNALDKKCWIDLHNLFEQVREDSNIKVVVLTGVGDSFASGDDIKECGVIMQKVSHGNASMMDVREITLAIQQVSWDIRNLSKPVIAAVNGYALGAGFELALACDLIYASDTAKFGLLEATIGFTITGGSSALLPKLIGTIKAKEMAFTADIIDSEKAKEIGLVNDVVPFQELMPKVYEIAKKIMACSPVAVSFMKSLLDMGSEVTFGTAIVHETETVLATLATDDCKEGVKAFFEKRSPNFTGC